MALDLDPQLGRRAGLEDALRRAVVTGRLEPGSRLSSTRALAEERSGTVVASLPVVGGDPIPEAPSGPPMLTDLLPGEPDLSSFPRRGARRGRG